MKIRDNSKLQNQMSTRRIWLKKKKESGIENTCPIQEMIAKWKYGSCLTNVPIFHEKNLDS